ncbi:MAG: lipid A biosynthesis acyltransferase [Phycisphaerae bacterium]|jgi:KDO2-lipid IV(A) lauroyltransferase
MTQPPRRSLRALWSEALAAAGGTRRAALFVLEYAAVRAWSLIINCFPVETNLRTARLLGRVWWLVMKRHRDRAMDNLRPALGHVYDETRLREIARRSFEHFAQVYLVELPMTPRLVTEWSWARHVELGDLGPALRELLSGRGALLLTAHFGNFELMGYAISRLGLPLTAIMRPLDNVLLNEFLVSTRRASGLSLLFKKGAMEAADDVIAGGGALCFIADQDAGRKGVFADFFGRPASWYKSIGLLAMRHRVPIIVGHATRIGAGFRYRLSIERIIQPEELDAADDPLAWVTHTFAVAMEVAIRRAPEQYLWAHRRWKTRPRGERCPPTARSRP